MRIIRVRALVHIGKPTQRSKVALGRTVRLCPRAGGQPLRLDTGQVPVLLEFGERAVVGAAKVEEAIGGMFLFAELALMGNPRDYLGLYPALGAVGSHIVSVGLCKTAAHPRIPALTAKDLHIENGWRKLLRWWRTGDWRP